MSSQCHLVCIAVLLAMLGSALAMPKPAFPLKHMDPVDSCLFICSMCFEDKLMLKCANQVCLIDVALGRPISKFWMAGCPPLQLPARQNAKV